MVLGETLVPVGGRGLLEEVCYRELSLRVKASPDFLFSPCSFLVEANSSLSILFLLPHLSLGAMHPSMVDFFHSVSQNKPLLLELAFGCGILRKEQKVTNYYLLIWKGSLVQWFPNAKGLYDAILCILPWSLNS